MTPDPVVILVDDDWETLSRLTGVLNPAYLVVPTRSGGDCMRAARRLGPEVFVIAETVGYGELGADVLLEDVIREFRGRVIVLVENGGDAGRENWKKRGAVDCLPHPTRYRTRGRRLDRAILEIIHAGRKESHGSARERNSK